MTDKSVKYTKKTLKDKVQKYFNSISRTVTLKDSKGEEVLNDEGLPITSRVFHVPPTAASLCLFLGIDTDTWGLYSDRELYPEFAEITSYANTVFEAYLVEQSLTREKSVQGILFNLQNNYGYKQKQEIELGEKTRDAASVANLTMAEKFALISSVKKSLLSGLGEDISPSYSEKAHSSHSENTRAAGEGDAK